jgi:hypothetical protein
LKIKVSRHELRINHAPIFAVVGALFDGPVAVVINRCASLGNEVRGRNLLATEQQFTVVMRPTRSPPDRSW